MTERQILFNGTVRAIDRQHAIDQVFGTQWVYAFPDGVTRPGKIVPISAEYDKLTILETRIIGVTPYVADIGEDIAEATTTPFMITLLLTFTHHNPASLDKLLALGTWFSPPNRLFIEVAWSKPAKPGAFYKLFGEEIANGRI